MRIKNEKYFHSFIIYDLGRHWVFAFVGIVIFVSGMLSFSSFAEEKVYDVIIIGAGISGLAAADALTQDGYDVAILEAKDRIGGRLWTDNSTGKPLDLGASWIHGIKHNPINLIVKSQNITTVPTIPERHVKFSHSYYDFEGKRLNKTAKRDLDNRYDDFIDHIYDKYAYHPGHPFKEAFLEPILDYSTHNDKSIKFGLDKYIEKIKLKSSEIEKFEHVSNYYFENTWAADISEISLRHWDIESIYGGVEVIFPHGYSQIIKPFENYVEIHENSIVRKIDYSKFNTLGDERIIDIYIDGKDKPYKTEYVISTIPLGVLKDSILGEKILNSKKGLVEFYPKLPKEKVEAIKNVGMGVMNKAYLVFPENENHQFNGAFWEDDIDVQYITFMKEDEGEWSFFFNLYPSLKQPILLAFNSGEYGKNLEKLDYTDPIFNDEHYKRNSKKNFENLENKISYDAPLEELSEEELQKYKNAVKKLAMDNLRRIYGEDIPEPKVVITRWTSDPFTRGSYSFPAVGSTPGDFYKIAEPVEGRVFFAGEATEPYHWGTVHGAYLSGIRAAYDVQWWYDWHHKYELEALLFGIVGASLMISWIPFFRWNTKRRIALDALGKSHQTSGWSTMTVVASLIFIGVLYFWLETSLGIIPDIFEEYFSEIKEGCYEVSRIMDVLPYLPVTEQTEERYKNLAHGCIDF